LFSLLLGFTVGGVCKLFFRWIFIGGVCGCFNTGAAAANSDQALGAKATASISGGIILSSGQYDSNPWDDTFQHDANAGHWEQHDANAWEQQQHDTDAWEHRKLDASRGGWWWWKLKQHDVCAWEWKQQLHESYVSWKWNNDASTRDQHK
jgi:hypothetical protein